MDEHGGLYEVTPRDAGFDQDIVDILDANTLRHNIEHLISLSVLTVEDLDYVCEDESSRIPFEQSRDHWIHQAFKLCCYVFPRSPIIDSS